MRKKFNGFCRACRPARNIINLSLILYKRDKRSAIWNYFLFPLVLILAGLFSFGVAHYFPEPYILSFIFAYVITLEILFLLLGYVKNLKIKAGHLYLFPFSGRARYNSLLLMILCDKRNLIHVVVISALNIALLEGVSTVIIFISIAILVLVCLQIWLLNISILANPLITKSDVWFQQFFVIAIVLCQVPILIKKEYLYNLYPFCGWIGSTANAAQNGQYGLVSVYFGFVTLLLIGGLWMGKNLVKPRKKTKWDL